MNNLFVLNAPGACVRGGSTRLRVLGRILLLACAVSAKAQTTTLAWAKDFGGTGDTQVQALTTDAQGNVLPRRPDNLSGSAGERCLPHRWGINLYRMPLSSPELQPLRTALGGAVTAIGLAAGASGVAYVATDSGLIRSGDNGATWQVLTLPASTLGFYWATAHKVLAIAVDPRDPNVVYVAGPFLGVLESADGGQTSMQVLDTDKLPSAEGVVLDPSAPSTVYATGSVSFARIAYRSDDGGKTWVGLGASVSPIVPDASSPGVLYGTGRSSMQRSPDRGATWQDLTLPNDCGQGQIVSDPVHRPNTYLVCGSLYRSKDQGSTWELLPVPVAAGEDINNAAADPIFPVLYATSSAGSIYRSSDGGDTWMAAARAASYPVSAAAASGGSLYLGTHRDADAFAAKLSPQGEVVWATYLGGSRDDAATSLALDWSGNVYVAGTTHSYDFPVSTGAYNGGFAWHTAGFVTELSPDGSQVLYASLLKLFGDLNGLAVDASGSAYLTGSTRDAIATTAGVVYPDADVVPGCDQPLPDGECSPPSSQPSARAFITKLNPTGSSLTYSTYLGDWSKPPYYSINEGRAVAVDHLGNAYAAGSLLWKLNASASTFGYVTIVPGYGEFPFAYVAGYQAAVLDKDENLITGGMSNGGFLFTTPGVWKPWTDGTTDGFLAKYDSRGNLVACTSMGATVGSLAMAGDGSILAGGPLLTTGGQADPNYDAGSYYTRSMLQGSFGDAWFGRYSADLSQLLFSSFVGRVPSGSVVRVGGLADGSPVAAVSGGPADSSSVLYATRTAESAGPRIDQIINEANSLPSPISPSERIVVYGARFGGNGARLLIGGAEAQVVSQGDNTIVAVVPNGMDSSNPADVAVEVNGVRSQTVPMPTTDQTLALYRAHPYPEPQALVFNQDGSLNSEANPAAHGSVVAIAVNGLGRYSVSGASIVVERVPAISINGEYANGVDANLLPAPGFAGQLTFLKVYVPDTAVSGTTPVPVLVGDAAPWPPWSVLTMWIK